MIFIMGLTEVAISSGSLVALLIAVTGATLVAYRLGIHAINKVAENATSVKYKDGEIRFRPPKD